MKKNHLQPYTRLLLLTPYAIQQNNQTGRGSLNNYPQWVTICMIENNDNIN